MDPLHSGFSPGIVFPTNPGAAKAVFLPERPAVAEFDQFLQDLLAFLQLHHLLAYACPGTLTHLQAHAPPAISIQHVADHRYTGRDLHDVREAASQYKGFLSRQICGFIFV